MKVLIRYGTKSAFLEEKVYELRKKYHKLDIILDYHSDILYLENIDILVTTRLSEADLINCNRLKYLIIPFTGVNTLPLKRLEELGVKVVNSHINAKYVAEKAIALALALLGKVVVLDNNLRNGSWNNSSWESIYNLKCGIIGMGEIGKRIISHLNPFDCEIITLERYRNNPNFHYYSTIKEVCLNSDLIFVSLPLTEKTKNIISADILMEMKGKYLINVGRGGTIEEEALYNALNDNVLKGAAIDVWYNYPQDGNKAYPANFPFHTLNNVVLSPHCAGNVLRCKDEEIAGFIKKIADLIEGNEIQNIVNYSKAY